VFLVEARRETEIGKLDVATSVEQDVVGLDVTRVLSVGKDYSGEAAGHTDG
jgi:hypothetical protein